MGFLKKAWNWITGKGYAEDEEIEKQKVAQEEKLERLQQAEDITPIQEKPRTEIKEPVKEEELKPRQQRPIQTKGSEIQQATKQFERSGSIAEVQGKLQVGTISNTTFTPTADLSTIKTVYSKLLERSTIPTVDREGNPDQALIGILIENREKIQHRFTAEISITTEKGIGRMSIDGILAEHLNSIYDFIQIGATYTSQELKTAMQDAITYFEKQYGSIGGNINPPMETKSTVQDIQIRMTFA